MQSPFDILLYFIVKTVWTPLFGEEWNRNNLTETINLQTTTTHRVHNRRVVNYLNSDTLLDTPEVKVSVSSGAEGIAND